jgi:hypothetical protein
METPSEPKRPREDFVRGAQHLAAGAEGHLPAWLRPGSPESRLPVLLALVAAIAMQAVIPERLTVVPRWPLVGLELALLGVLLILNPVHLTRSTKVGRYASYVLLAAIAGDNTASAAALDYHIVTGRASNNPALLLGSGAAIFVTNMIVYGIWYWELDRGGPFGRLGDPEPQPKGKYPDFLFPQDAAPRKVAPKNWEPRFLDYLYVSVTNVMAFSPTDTMPLTHRAKALMTLQAIVAVSTLALVFARAVNVLG